MVILCFHVYTIGERFSVKQTLLTFLKKKIKISQCCSSKCAEIKVSLGTFFLTHSHFLAYLFNVNAFLFSLVQILTYIHHNNWNETQIFDQDQDIHQAL